MITTPNNLISNLHIARQAMGAQQIGLDVVGQNVANLNTEGYVRKRAQLQTAPVMSGVTVEGIRRYVNEFADKQLVSENSLLGYGESKSEILGHVAELFNDLQDTGLGAALDNFFGSLRNLESNPGDLTSRQEVLARGDEMASAFNRIASEMEQVRRGNDDLLRASVAEINVRVEEIAQLNDRISQGKALGGLTGDDEDRRDQLLRELAEHVDINYLEDKDGKYTVFLEGGNPLVEGINYSTLQINDAAVPGSADIEYVSTNGSSTIITSSLTGGRIGGVLQARDVDIPSYQLSFDQLAYDIIDAVNVQHNLGFGMDTVGGRDFFTDHGGVVTNAALNMTLSADVDGLPENIAAAGNAAALEGDNDNSILLANLPEQLLAEGGTMTFNEAYATIVGNVGVDTRQAENSVSMRQMAITSVEQVRNSESGVSLDEELSYMLAYQRAYQASARMISTTDGLLETVLNMKR